MKLRTLLLPLVALTACAVPPPLPEGQRIGERLEEREAVRLSVVSSDPDAYYEQTLLVEATVVAVCVKKGCWMQVDDGGRRTMVRWEAGCGGQYAFPMDSVGKRVLIQGSFYPTHITADDAEHLKEESGGDLQLEEDTFEMNASAVLVLDEA